MGQTLSILLAVGALALAGCGGTDDPEPSENEAATDESAGQQDSDVDTDSDMNSDTESDSGTGGEAGQQDGAAAFAVDSCSLLTADAVAAATGANAEEGVFNADLSSAGQSICEWITDASGVAFVQVVVNESSAATQRDSAEEFLGDAQDVDIPGATDAYLIEGLVGAQVGPYFVQVTVVPSDDAAAQALAAQAAGAIG